MTPLNFIRWTCSPEHKNRHTDTKKRSIKVIKASFIVDIEYEKQMQTKTGDLLVCQLFSKISEGAGDTRRADTTGGTTSAKDGAAWTITLHKVWPIYWFQKWLQEFPWHFLMTFRTLLEDLKKSKLLAETKLLAQRCKAARLWPSFKRGPPLPLASWVNFCVPIFYQQPNVGRFSRLVCLGSFARKWGGCDVCPGWRGGKMFLGVTSPDEELTSGETLGPPLNQWGFYIRGFKKNLPFWFWWRFISLHNLVIDDDIFMYIISIYRDLPTKITPLYGPGLFQEPHVLV